MGSETFAANPDGYDRLIDMLPGPGAVAAVGVEGTNSFGAALARRLAAAGYEVREVLRPKRNVRRRNGKSDPIDAVAAARSVMAGDDAGPPKSSDGWGEALRHLNAQLDQRLARHRSGARQGTVPGIEGRGPYEQTRRVQARRRPGRA